MATDTDTAPETGGESALKTAVGKPARPESPG